MNLSEMKKAWKSRDWPRESNTSQVERLTRLVDPFEKLPANISTNICLLLPFENRTRLELVSKKWRKILMMADGKDERPVWVYIIFRKNVCSRSVKMNVNLSFDGPVFWDRQVAYIYTCSCHFAENEGPLLALLMKLQHRVERVCIVDKPVDYPFLPDSLFSYIASNMPRLQFIYLREVDLEKINRGTVVELAKHRQLKKVIVHGCRNYEVLQDFHNLPQLLVVKGDIVGLKSMIGDIPGIENDEMLVQTMQSDDLAAI